jgi:acyl-coenzyme A synthetase/AMP-(fatty) acid ligase
MYVTNWDQWQYLVKSCRWTKLPKTRSGKIMRRILRAQEMGEDLGDTSTLEE